jgi:hypothetical protein
MHMTEAFSMHYYHEHIWFHQCQEDINSLYHFERISGNIPGAYVTSHFHILYKVSPFAAACLEYFFFSIDSSEARKRYDE